MKLRMTASQAGYFLISLIGLILLPILDSIIAWKIIILVEFFWLFILTTKKRNFSLYQVFLLTYFLFLLSRIFLDVCGLYDFKTLALMQNSYMTDEIALGTIKVLSAFLVGTSYAWMIVDNSSSDNFFERPIAKLSFNNFLRVLYYIFIALSVMKMVYFLNVVRKNGYLALFNGTIGNIGYPVIFTGAISIAEALFVVLMFYNRDKKSFLQYSGLLLLVGLTKMMTGQRAYGLVLLLYIICMYSTYYKEVHFYNRKILLIGLIVPIAIVALNHIRFQVSVSLRDLFEENVYVRMMISQGSSIEVVSGVNQYSDSFTNKVPFMIGYFVDLFKREPAGQTMLDITQGNYLGDHLSYAINPTMFLAGRGTGTSLVAETFDLVRGNYLLIFGVACILTLLVLKISQRAYKSVYNFAFSYYLMTDFIFSPRDSIFKSIKSIVIVLVFCAIVKAICRSYSTSSTAIHSAYNKAVSGKNILIGGNKNVQKTIRNR